MWIRFPGETLNLGANVTFRLKAKTTFKDIRGSSKMTKTGLEANAFQPRFFVNRFRN